MVKTELREMLGGRKIPREGKAGQCRLLGLRVGVPESLAVLQDPLPVPMTDTHSHLSLTPGSFWMSSF